MKESESESLSEERKNKKWKTERQKDVKHDASAD